MATKIRVIVSHVDANGKILTGFGTESFLINAATVDENGISTVLANNSFKRGSRIHVHSYANLDKEHQGGNILS